MNRQTLLRFCRAMIGWDVISVTQDKDGTHVVLTDGTTLRTVTYGKYNKISSHEHKDEDDDDSGQYPL